MHYYSVSDTYIILEQPHDDEPMRVLGYFDPESIRALSDLLEGKNTSTLSDEERKKVRELTF
jgi:hypothetical protein